MKIKAMGVMNITPNSFSDGIESPNLIIFKNKLNEINSWANIIDVGAESTAPFNDAINSSTEIERFQKYFIPLLKDIPQKDLYISIDTYKIKTFEFVAKEILKILPQARLIFNDVSGCLDDELLNFLRNSPLNFDYVLCHNLSPIRSETSNHINYMMNSHGPELFDEMIVFFEESFEKLKDIKRRIIIDPCYGFSKDREQNQYLVKKFPDIVKSLSEYSSDFVFGISRKSFMRFPKDSNPKGINKQREMELMQAALLSNIISALENHDVNIIVRNHDGLLFKALDNISQFGKC